MFYWRNKWLLLCVHNENMYFSFLITWRFIDLEEYKQGIHNVGSNWCCRASSFVLCLENIVLITLICSCIMYLSLSTSSSSFSKLCLSARSGSASSSSMIMSFMLVFVLFKSHDELLLLFLYKDPFELLVSTSFVCKRVSL